MSNTPAPKVSVVVITYNQEKYIGRALESILAQKCDFDFEIVLGDDCSTDATSAICREYRDKYPHIINYRRNETNKGLQANYYDCILASRGEYIADCGGDDFWIDDKKLQKQADLLDADPETVLVHTDWLYYDESTGERRPSLADGISPQARQKINECGTLTHQLVCRDEDVAVDIHSCTMMIRRDAIVEAHTEDPQMFRNPAFKCEDKQLLVALSMRGSIRYIDDVTLCYSVGKPSMTSNSTRALCDFYFGSLQLSRYMQQKYGITTADMEKLYDRMSRYVTGLAFLDGDKKRYREIEKFVKSLGIKLPGSVKIKNAATRIAPLWRIMRRL